MKSNKDVAQYLVGLLEHIRKRPGLYLGSEDPGGFQCLITGMILAFQMVGYAEVLPRNDLFRDTLVQERGWDISSNLVGQMQARGMSDSEIFNELIDIEVESLRRRVELG